MLKIELETYEAAKAFFRANMRKETDWEQRKYEIAKECLVALMPEVKEQSSKLIKSNASFPIMTEEEICKQLSVICQGAVDISVQVAEALVAKLKAGK